MTVNIMEVVEINRLLVRGIYHSEQLEAIWQTDPREVDTTQSSLSACSSNFTSLFGSQTLADVYVISYCTRILALPLL